MNGRRMNFKNELLKELAFRLDIERDFFYNLIRWLSGRSSVWLERYLGVVEAARSSRVAPTSKIKPIRAFFVARKGENDRVV